jgi:quercetin dioxygenase-like cupin family protein
MTRECIDLQSEIDALLAEGYRLDMIMPADEPTIARLSRGNEHLELRSAEDPKFEIRKPRSKGRAGMEYRDLIPDRLNGRVIASHIRIAEGGNVPDYVHYHKVRFQMIYCKSGWVRVVYEDQGPPFVLNAGDCVLQPPEIRHRVLESSAGAEVIEITSPAVHETWVEHELTLPTGIENAARVFNRQRFVRFIATDGTFISDSNGGGYVDTGIAAATRGLASVRIWRIQAGDSIHRLTGADEKRPCFLFVLAGKLTLQDFAPQAITLEANDSCVVTGRHDVTAAIDTLVLEVLLPSD